MLILLSNWLNEISRGWVAFLALVIFLLFTVLVLPVQATGTEMVGNSPGSPDTSFFYSVDDLYRMAEAYGQAGRDAYLRARFTFDLIWPLVYTIFLVTGISWVSQKAFPPESLWQRLNLAPILAALFDYLENICTSLVMSQFPNRLPLVAVLASLFTMAKWILLGCSFVLLFIGVGAAVLKWAKRKAR